MKKTISKEISEAREALGMSRKQFANAINNHTKQGRVITPQSLRGYEKDGVEPATSVSDKIRAYIAVAVPDKIKELKKL
jgi:transcriptional regulator with XRE-family HTH domain